VVLKCTVLVRVTTVVVTGTSDVEFPATGVELDTPVESGMLLDSGTSVLDEDSIPPAELDDGYGV
jgi:hypothetical protein